MQCLLRLMRQFLKINLNADVNGAANILRKAVPDAFEKVNDFSYLKHPYVYGFYEVNPTGISYAASAVDE